MIWLLVVPANSQALPAPGNEASNITVLSLRPVQDYCIFVRDLVMVLPFLSVFLHTNCEALRNPEEGVQKAVQNLFVSVTDIFHCWFSSQVQIAMNCMFISSVCVCLG